MENEKVKAKTGDLDAYLSCIDNIKTKVPSVSSSINQELSALTTFFLQPQTNKTRQGILLLLNTIQDDREYTLFLTLCEELLKVQVGDEEEYTFFYFLYESPAKIYELLNCIASIYGYFKNYTHKILIYLFRLGSYVAVYSNNTEYMEQFVNFFARRTHNFLSGMQGIRQQLNNMYSQLPKNLRVSKETMTPTDGDMHCGGKIPYFITYSGMQFVYKPRNMKVDFLVIEALIFFSSFLREEIQPPIFSIHLFKDDVGMMDFATHTKKMEEEQAKSYFLKFGALLCFTSLLGIEDLHYENIMATEKGPVLIDLECSLNLNLISEKKIANEPLRQLREAFVLKQSKNATFSVNGDILPLSTWKEFICNGFLEAARCFQKNKVSLIGYYSSLLQQPFYRRIVPIKTGDFYTYMYNAVYLSADSLQSMLDIIRDEIINYLRDFGIEAQLIQTNILQQTIYNALFWGDIPFLQLAITVDAYGNLQYAGYIDKVCFFKPTIINTVSFFEQQFEEKIDWLNTEEAIDLLEKFIDRR